MINQDNKPGESSNFESLQSEPLTSAGSLAPASTNSVPYNGQPDDLHDLFGSKQDLNADEDDPLAALRNDPNYSALIKDLEYIASQARLLFEPAEENPSEKVWDNIVKEMREKPEESA